MFRSKNTFLGPVGFPKKFFLDGSTKRLCCSGSLPLKNVAREEANGKDLCFQRKRGGV